MQRLRRHLPLLSITQPILQPHPSHSVPHLLLWLACQSRFSKDVRATHLEASVVWNQVVKSSDANALNAYCRVWCCAWAIKKMNMIQRLKWKAKNEKPTGDACTESPWPSTSQMNRKMCSARGHIQSSLWYSVVRGAPPVQCPDPAEREKGDLLQLCGVTS